MDESAMRNSSVRSHWVIVCFGREGQSGPLTRRMIRMTVSAGDFEAVRAVSDGGRTS